MTQWQMLETAFYGSLAGFALWATWRVDGVRQVGVTLALCWAASNLAFWFVPIEYRTAVNPIIDVMFILAAAKAGMETKSRVPLVLITLSVLAIVINTAFSMSAARDWSQLHLYEVSLNLIFVLQCLVTSGWGIADADWVDRFRNLPVFRRHRAQYPHRSKE